MVIWTEGDQGVMRRSQDMETKQRMPDLHFTSRTETRKLKQCENFITPGIDKIPCFQLKKYDSFHPHLATSFSNSVSSQEELPECPTQGNTSLLSKSPETQRANREVQADLLLNICVCSKSLCPKDLTCQKLVLYFSLLT